MKIHSLIIVMAAITLSLAASARAQGFGEACGPACPAGEEYRDGGCYHDCAPLAPCSHTRASCPEGTTLNRDTGICVPPTGCPGSGGSGCVEKPACAPPSFYTGDSDGKAVCETRSGLNYRAHELVPCADGWSLVPGTGHCRHCDFTVRIPVGPRPWLRPDLIFRMVQLGPHGAPVGSVHRGHPYYVCFIVANVGPVASGPFRVAGGGLGIPTIPFQNHAGLAAGAERKGCLLYPTTPAAGKYMLGLEVDSLHAVAESNEGNNTRNLPVLVVP